MDKMDKIELEITMQCDSDWAGDKRDCAWIRLYIHLIELISCDLCWN